MILKDILNPSIAFGGSGSGGGGGGGGGSERKQRPTTVQAAPAAKNTNNADTRSDSKEPKASAQVAQAAPAEKTPIVSDAPAPAKETKAAPVSVQPVASPKGSDGGSGSQPVSAPETLEGVNGASGTRDGGAGSTSKASTIREENARARTLRDGQEPYQRGRGKRVTPSRGPNPFRIFNRR